jgi:hypothetical protein
MGIDVAAAVRGAHAVADEGRPRPVPRASRRTSILIFDRAIAAAWPRAHRLCCSCVHLEPGGDGGGYPGAVCAGGLGGGGGNGGGAW